MFYLAAPHLVPLSNLQRVNKPYTRKLKRSLSTINLCHPRISPPVREHSRIVIAKYIDVSSMNKVVCENILIATFVQWSNHSNIRWRKVVLGTNNMKQFLINVKNQFIDKTYIAPVSFRTQFMTSDIFHSHFIHNLLNQINK